MKNTLFRTSAVCAAAALTAAAGFSAAAAQGEKINLEDFPGEVIDEVIVPVPSEIFTVLDKLGRPNWKAEVRTQKPSPVTDRTERALQFGMVVADGFIAVQAEDREMIKELGHEVLNMADALGVRQEVVTHAQSIIDSADRGDFEEVRAELDRTQNTVRSKMERMRDEDLAQLVSIGGWLRGTEVVTSLISKSYSQEKAELLQQPDLVAHFTRSIDRMDASVKNKPNMTKIAQGLGKIETAMTAADGGAIPSNSVHEIHQVCADLVDRIAK